MPLPAAPAAAAEPLADVRDRGLPGLVDSLPSPAASAAAPARPPTSIDGSGSARERGTPDAALMEATVAYMEEAGGPKGAFELMSKAMPTWQENGYTGNALPLQFAFSRAPNR